MSIEFGYIFHHDSSLQLGLKQRISGDYGNQRYLIGVTDTERIYGVMRLHPLGPGDGSKVIFRHGRYDMGLVRSLVLSSPSEMDEFWRSRVAHPRLFHAPTRTTSSGCLVLDRTVHALWNLYGKIMQKRKEKPSRDKGIPKQPLVYL